MASISEFLVTRQTSLMQALSQLDKYGYGILLLVNQQGTFERTVTDGDLRRLLLNGVTLNDSLESLAEISSVVVNELTSRRDALDLMNKHVINHLPVVDKSGVVIDVLDRKELDDQILLSTPHIGAKEREFVEEAFKTNWIAPLGPNVDAFEKELAELVGVGHAAAVTSGTAAIHLALRILDVGPGDTVFCSTLTFAASANPIVYQSATPVFIDSDLESWNMAPEALEKALVSAKAAGKLPKAVIVVNLYGQSSDMDRIVALCDAYGVPVVEDAAESLGAFYKGKASGSFGTIGIYSFNGNKIITTSGGGMLVSDNKEYMDRARFLATQARDPAPHYQHSEIGFNYRMSNILAGVGRGQLKVLSERVEARRAVYDKYRQSLSDIEELQWMPEPAWSRSTHWLTACTVDGDAEGAKKLIRALAAELIEARPIWKPMHLQPVFAHCEFFSHADTPVADYLFNNGVCLPSGSNMSEEQMERVIAVIRKALRG